MASYRPPLTPLTLRSFQLPRSPAALLPRCPAFIAAPLPRYPATRSAKVSGEASGGQWRSARNSNGGQRSFQLSSRLKQNNMSRRVMVSFYILLRSCGRPRNRWWGHVRAVKPAEGFKREESWKQAVQLVCFLKAGLRGSGVWASVVIGRQRGIWPCTVTKINILLFVLLQAGRKLEAPLTSAGISYRPPLTSAGLLRTSADLRWPPAGRRWQPGDLG